MDATTRRLFVGIPIAKQDCPKFFSWTQNLVDQVKEEGWNVRWANPDNYHITISFLGDSSDHCIEKITTTLRENTFRSFWIQIQNLGIFQNNRHSNLLWAGMESKNIHAFREQIENLMVDLGYKDTKLFHPHITLGRFKQTEKEFHEPFISTALDQFKVTRFCLFESLISFQNIEYKILETFRLI